MSELHTETLMRYVDRIENAEADKRAASDVLNGIYAEVKEAGFVPALLRQVVKERRIEAGIRDAQYALLNSYREALGLFADTPLGEAAMRAENVTPLPLPRAFADQPVHQDRRRGRPRKVTAREVAEDLLGA
jgi:uncharacterized protein (UPF0335 family)